MVWAKHVCEQWARLLSRTCFHLPSVKWETLRKWVSSEIHINTYTDFEWKQLLQMVNIGHKKYHCFRVHLWTFSFASVGWKRLFENVLVRRAPEQNVFSSTDSTKRDQSLYCSMLLAFVHWDSSRNMGQAFLLRCFRNWWKPQLSCLTLPASRASHAIHVSNIQWHSWLYFLLVNHLRSSSDFCQFSGLFWGWFCV